MSAVSSEIAFERFAERALKDVELELEVGIDMPISNPMFCRLLKALRASQGPCEEILQLDVSRNSARYEFHGAETIRAALSPQGSAPPTLPTCVLVKRREMAPVRHEDYDYTIRLKREMDSTQDLKSSTSALTSSDAFRLKRRFSFDAGMCRIDCTVVQSRSPTAERSAEHTPFMYEVEVEMKRDAAGGGSATPRDVTHAMTQMVLRCMGIMQGCSVPMGRAERNSVLQYISKLSGVGAPTRLPAPQPVTLMLSHVQPAADGDRPLCNTIWDGNYTVTDKADGVRSFLIALKGCAYIVDSNLTVRRVCSNVPPAADCSCLDGELITRSSGGGHLNLFAAFDAYAAGGRDVTNLPLKASGSACRLAQVSAILDIMKRAEALDAFQAQPKRFWMVDAEGAATREALENARFRLPYETDGLMFTPADAPVGGRYAGDEVHLDGTWPQVLKWKPAEMNTVDFLLRAPDEGLLSQATLEGKSVQCCQYDMYASYVPRKWEAVDVSKFIRFGERALPNAQPRPRRFESGKCSKVIARLDSSGHAVCESGDPLYAESVVECRFTDGSWRPVRIRPDKTARLANGVAGAANDWGTACNVWSSICEPVTDRMVQRLDEAPAAASSKSYYARREFARHRSALVSMTAFHNTVVKARLYQYAARESVSNGPPSLFEIACGRGGDAARWAEGRFSPIVGIDNDMDNIVAADGGVYARMTKFREAFAGRTLVFVCLDATVRMRPPLDEVRCAASSSPHGDVISALWDTTKRPIADAAFSPIRGLVCKGFDVVSCQFAIHYMFATDSVLDKFIQNVKALLRPGGIFIGTCFDGDRLARELEAVQGGTLRANQGGHCPWTITKRYPGAFAGTTGCAIDVFVETINRTATEYLVSPRLLIARLQAQGLRSLFMRPFCEYHQYMGSDLASRMTPAERAFSSKNMAFAFKRDVAETRDQ